MGATELQSNWPDMRKTLGKPGFCSGEDRIRTCGKSPEKTWCLQSNSADSGALVESIEDIGQSDAITIELASIIEAWPKLSRAIQSKLFAMVVRRGQNE
jgi:hypothetical protein